MEAEAEVKDKIERKLKKVKIGLMRERQYAMWSGIMMIGKTHIDDDTPTACTNGRDEWYGRKFIASLSDKELAFVILHENLHKAFRHMTTWYRLWKEDPRLANQACDYVINLMLVRSDPNEKFLSVPMRDGKPIALIDERFAGMNAKQVFDILKQEKKERDKGRKPGDQGEPGDEEGDGSGLDEHDWEGAKELTEGEKKELEKAIEEGLRNGAMAAGRMPGSGAGGMDRAIDELLAPKIDWRDALREFVTSVCRNKDVSSWRRVNRRFLSEDMYMPSLVGESIGHIVIGIDTSGSIGGPILTRFLSEVAAVASTVSPEKIDLIYWDARVAGHEQYTGSNAGEIINSTKVKGGGGTDPRCVSAYLKDKGIRPECIIMLTDGEISGWGDDWDAPILWAVSNTHSKPVAPCGKTIHIEEV